MPDVNSELSTDSKQKLVSDMKVVVSHAEELLRATAGVADEKMNDLRERIGQSLRDAKLRLADAEGAVVDKPRPPHGPPTTSCTRTRGAPSASRPSSACCSVPSSVAARVCPAP
jgi:hypothetical protein